MNKKSQSLLVSFSVHLVGIMVFFIVLIALLSMTHNVKYVISDFDEQTASILVDRRLTSSADCLAYESRAMVVEPNSHEVLTGSRVYPNVIDVRKLNDFEHVNCIRKDMYDLMEDVRNGVWDAAKGSGAAQKYDLIPINLSNGFVFMKNPDETEFKSHVITSLLSRVQKKIISDSLSHDDENTPSEDHSITACGEDIDFSSTDDTDNSGCITFSKFCATGCDKYTDAPVVKKGICNGEIRRRDYDNHPPNFYHGACVVKENETLPEGVSPRWAYNPNYFAFYNIVASDTKKPNYQIGIWNQNNTTCLDSETSNRAMIPVSFYDNSKLINGVLVIDTCVLKGENHKGLSLPEIIYKPTYHKSKR